MGKAIVYCGSCGKSLFEEDFERGRAVRTASQSFCARCSPIDPAALPSYTPARATALPTQTPGRPTPVPKSSSTTRIPKVSTGRIPTVASTRRIKPAGSEATSTALWIGLGAVAGLVILGLFLALSGPPRPGPAPARPPSGERPSPTPPRPSSGAPQDVPPAAKGGPATPVRPAAPPNEVEMQMRQELAALRANRFDHDLQEARRLVEGAHTAERAAEIDGLLDALSRVAGPRLPDVVALRARHEERMAAARATAEAPPPAEPPAPATGAPAGLEGHWTLDVLKDGRAADASGLGRHAAVVGAPRLVPGRHGQAVLFEGDEAYLELPRRGGLDRLQEGPYTLSAWFKPTDSPQGPESDNGAFYGIVIKHGLHVGLSYTFKQGGTFEMMHWLRGVVRAGDYVKRPSPPGTWYHLAGQADPASGRTRLYVNAERLLDVAWPEGVRAAEAGYTRKPWRIGIAIPKAKEWGWSARGAVDDVRLYSRILDESEIQALASGR